MLTVILFAVLICSLIINCVLLYWVIYYKNELYCEKDLFLYNRNKISMIEYHYRNYKEGTNPYTVLRDMGEIIQSYYNKMGVDDGEKGHNS